MRTEREIPTNETKGFSEQDLNKILDQLGVPVGIKRAAALAALGALVLGGFGLAHVYASKEVEIIGPDPNPSCPGDFDVSKGVVVNEKFEYLGLGTAGQKVEIGDDYMTKFNNGQLRLLRHVHGGKKLGDVIGWSFTDKSGDGTSGWIQFSKNGEITCEDK